MVPVWDSIANGKKLNTGRAIERALLFQMDIPTLMTGYQGLREQAAWIDLSTRGKIRLEGEDRARLLHAMTTNDVQNLKPDHGCYAFFLNAQGRILGDVNIFSFEDSILLDTEPETRAKLYEHLDRYIIADDVTLRDETDHLATISIEGPQATGALAQIGILGPEVAYAAKVDQGWIVARADTTGAGGYLLIGPNTEKSALLERLAAAGIPQATPEEARTVRLEHGRPRYGEEITERYLVQETNQMHAISFHKGCYLGQEIVERVRSRAQIHRILRKIEIDSPTPPAAGTKLKAGDTDAGEIVSASYSEGLGKTVAMAYVRVPSAEPGTVLSVAAARAMVS